MSKLDRKIFKAEYPVILNADALGQLDEALEEAENTINDWFRERERLAAKQKYAERRTTITTKITEIESGLSRLRRRRKNSDDDLAEIRQDEAELKQHQIALADLERAESATAAKTYDEYASRTTREVNVEYLRDSDKYLRKSFAELDSAIKDKRGEFYEIRAVVTNYSAGIKLTFKITTIVFNRLIIELEQSSAEILDDVFEKIKRIVCANYVTGWQRQWARLRYFGAVLMCMSISGAQVMYTSSTTTDDARAQHVKQAQELIDRGVKPEDLPKAIDLTLRLQINYPSSSSTTYPFRHRRAFTILGAMFGLGVLLFSGPKGVMVGVGHGKSAIKSRETRVKLLVAVVLFMIPAIVDVLKPTVLDTLFTWLWG